MSRVSINEVATGDVLNTTEANKTLDNWASATSSINPTNIREEGLDERCFDDNSVILDLKSIGSSGEVSYNGDWPSTPTYLPALGGGVELGPFDLSDSTTTCIVRASFEMALQASDVNSDRPYGQVAIGYSEDNANWTIIYATLRRFLFHESVTQGDGTTRTSPSDPGNLTRPFEIAVQGVTYRCITTIAHEFELSNSSTVFFGLFIRQNSTSTLNIALKDPYLTVEVFGR